LISKRVGPTSSAIGARIDARGSGVRRGFPPPLLLGRGLFPSPEKKFEFRSQIFDFGYILGSFMTVKELNPG